MSQDRTDDRDLTTRRPGDATGGEDRFAAVAPHYDRWIGWGPRLKKELPFLFASLPAGATVLDAGCGTGAHARALAAAGFRVTGADASAAMLEQARAVEADAAGADSTPADSAPADSAPANPTPAGVSRAEPRDPTPVEWLEADLSRPNALGSRRFGAVLALGNVVPAFGEDEAVRRGVDSLVAHTALGGVLILQYLNGERIRSSGRLVVKGAAPTSAGGAADEALWLRHHFAAGDRLYFHSYKLERAGGDWTADVQARDYHDYPRAEVVARLLRDFTAVELFDGLSGQPFVPESSDSLGIRATGRR